MAEGVMAEGMMAEGVKAEGMMAEGVMAEVGGQARKLIAAQGCSAGNTLWKSLERTAWNTK
jgi:hypothetical protein